MMQRPGPMVDGPRCTADMAPTPARSFQSTTTQVRFVGPIGMKIGWKIVRVMREPIGLAGTVGVLAGRDLPAEADLDHGREGLTLYPTCKSIRLTDDRCVPQPQQRPIELTDEDLDQIESNNFVTKVIYLRPQVSGTGDRWCRTLSSTRLDRE